ncbi:MAG: hypothetical protein SFZ03_03160 [Candidatus Melainabacteria bacterium]|nr:hypothetical protein [Candidatus Melainabacteria bacterium]
MSLNMNVVLGALSQLSPTTASTINAIEGGDSSRDIGGTSYNPQEAGVILGTNGQAQVNARLHELGNGVSFLDVDNFDSQVNGQNVTMLGILQDESSGQIFRVYEDAAGNILQQSVTPEGVNDTAPPEEAAPLVSAAGIEEPGSGTMNSLPEGHTIQSSDPPGTEPSSTPPTASSNQRGGFLGLGQLGNTLLGAVIGFVTSKLFGNA